ncbi:MAG: glycoside hydrolase family 73 protein, partial [Terriglobia bacterium]
MRDYQSRFLHRLVPAVVRLQQETGLPASVVLAQAILESDWGRSLLARRNHNLFGIKAHPSARTGRDGQGSAATDAVVYSTTEYTGKLARRVKARFARYPSYDQCLQDYVRLLSRLRYAPARA